MGNNSANFDRKQQMQHWFQSGDCDFRTPGKPFLVHNKNTNQNGQSYSITFQSTRHFQKQNQIYKRRSGVFSSHLVQVYGLKQETFNVLSLVDQKFTMQVITECVPWRFFLQPLNSLSLAEALYILDGVLDGVQQLFQAFGRPFSIEPQMIGINPKGVVKIWSNPNFGKNLPQQRLQMHFSSKPMIRSIVEVVSSYVIPGQFQELIKRIQKIGNLSFYKMKFTLDQYISETRLSLKQEIGMNILKRGYRNNIQCEKNINILQNKNYHNIHLNRNQSQLLNIKKNYEKQVPRLSQNYYSNYNDLGDKTKHLNLIRQPIKINLVNQYEKKQLVSLDEQNYRKDRTNTVQSHVHKHFNNIRSKGHSKNPSNISNLSNQNDNNLRYSSNLKDDTFINGLKQFQSIQLTNSLHKRHSRVQSSTYALKRAQTHPDLQTVNFAHAIPIQTTQNQNKKFILQENTLCSQRDDKTYSIYNNNFYDRGNMPLRFGPIKAKLQFTKNTGEAVENVKTIRNAIATKSVNSESTPKQGNSLNKVPTKGKDRDQLMRNKPSKTHRRFISNGQKSKRSSPRYSSKKKSVNTKVYRPVGLKKDNYKTNCQIINNKNQSNHAKKTTRNQKQIEYKETTWRPFKSKENKKTEAQLQAKRLKAREFSRQLAEKVKQQLFKIINSEVELEQELNQHNITFIMNEDENGDKQTFGILLQKDDTQTVKFQDMQLSESLEVNINRKAVNIYHQENEINLNFATYQHQMNKLGQSVKENNIFGKQANSIQTGKFIMMNEVQPTFNKEIKRKKKPSKLGLHVEEEDFSLEVPEETEIKGHMILFKNSGSQHKKISKHELSNDQTIKIR